MRTWDGKGAVTEGQASGEDLTVGILTHVLRTSSGWSTRGSWTLENTAINLSTSDNALNRPQTIETLKN